MVADSGWVGRLAAVVASVSVAGSSVCAVSGDWGVDGGVVGGGVSLVVGGSVVLVVVGCVVGSGGGDSVATVGPGSVGTSVGTVPVCTYTYNLALRNLKCAHKMVTHYVVKLQGFVNIVYRGDFSPASSRCRESWSWSTLAMRSFREESRNPTLPLRLFCSSLRAESLSPSSLSSSFVWHEKNAVCYIT